MPFFAHITLLTLLLTLPVHGASTYKESYPDEMPENVKTFFKEAVSKAYTRMFSDGGVLRCVDKNARMDYVDPKTVTEHHGKAFLDAGILYKTQIRIFGAHVSNGAELPPIKVMQGYKEGFAYAWAHYGLVHTTEKEGRLFWHGGFEVTINSAKILDAASSDVWAGVMAHEMLHNMMHAHERAEDVGQDKAYAGDILINTMQNCVTDAADLRNYSGTYRCGGRQP